MKNNVKLSQSTIEKLDHYVYLLKDPVDGVVFYVGKGQGNRINAQLFGVLDKKNQKPTVERIRKIESKNGKVIQVVLRHSLSEQEAFHVESAMIDFLGKENLLNIVLGHKSEDVGIMDLEDIKIKYEAENADFDDKKVLLINVNKLYYKKMGSNELYEITRKSWKADLKKVKNVEFVCTVYRGIIREVFIAKKWFNSKKENGRIYFVGSLADSPTRNLLNCKSVKNFWKKGSSNPIRYINL